MTGVARQASGLPFAENPAASRGHFRRSCSTLLAGLWLGLGASATQSCGGTTGREGLPSQVAAVGDAGDASDAGTNEASEGTDATVDGEAGPQDLYVGTFDVALAYADRTLPDVVIAPTTDGAVPDASEGAAGGLVPCTAAGQTGCVACPNQPTGVCTPTEAAFVQLDIAAKAVPTAPAALDAGKEAGAAPDAGGVLPDYVGAPSLTGNCLSCIVAGGCLDFDLGGVTGVECGDFSGPFIAGNGAMGTVTSACLSALDCMVSPAGMGCAANSGGTEYCYCGAGGFAGGGASTCKANGSKANGACFYPEANGFKYTEVDARDIVNNYSDTTGGNPSGIANQILACAASNGCNACLQGPH